MSVAVHTYGLLRAERGQPEVQAMNRRIPHLEEGQALINQRLDRLDARVSRIEKRLDLVEG